MRCGYLVLALSVFVCGCAARPQLTREESLAATQRTYPGVTVEQAITAAETVLRLADGDDFRFAHTANGFEASRFWMVYVVLAFASGTDHWRFIATPSEGGVAVAVLVSTQGQGTSPTPTPTGGWAAAAGPVIGAPVPGDALYDLFWARMDYLLGLRPEWTSCAAADDRVASGAVHGPIEALCNAFNVDDDAPAGSPADQKPAG